MFLNQQDIFLTNISESRAFALLTIKFCYYKENLKMFLGKISFSRSWITSNSPFVSEEIEEYFTKEYKKSYMAPIGILWRQTTIVFLRFNSNKGSASAIFRWMSISWYKIWYYS